MPPGATTVRPTVAGTGVLIGGLRGTPAIQSLEQSLFNASRPSSLAARWESELVIEAGEPVPRLVFGAVPSFQEAKEATVELKETLDELYPFSLESSELETLLIPGLSLPLNTEERENRSRLIWERRTSNPGPEHALQALKLLINNPEVKAAVTSIASDPNVYNAMIENPEVKQCILENRTSSDTIEDEANVTQVGESGAGYMGKLRNLKDSVIRMVTNIPINLPNLFGSSAAEGATSGSDHKENTQSPPKGGKSASGFVEKLRPEHALQAFRLLRNNPKVQTVVASIASDPTVYNAVIENPEVKQFILENRTSSDTIEDEANVTQVGESGAGYMGKLRNLKDSVIRMVTNIPINLPNLFGSSAAEGATSGSDHKENTQSPPKGGKSASGFVEKLRSLKNSVVEMAAYIPNYLPNVFGSSAAETVSGSDHKGNTESSPTDWNLGTSLIGLAVMVIMVVVFKRV